MTWPENVPSAAKVAGRVGVGLPGTSGCGTARPNWPFTTLTTSCTGESHQTVPLVGGVSMLRIVVRYEPSDEVTGGGAGGSLRMGPHATPNASIGAIIAPRSASRRSVAICVKGHGKGEASRNPTLSITVAISRSARYQYRRARIRPIGRYGLVPPLRCREKSKHGIHLSSKPTFRALHFDTDICRTRSYRGHPNDVACGTD